MTSSSYGYDSSESSVGTDMSVSVSVSDGTIGHNFLTTTATATDNEQPADVQPAAVQPDADELAQLKAGDELVDERKEEEEERIRMTTLQFEKDVASLVAQRDKQIADIKADFAAEGVKQYRNGNLGMRKLKVELEDAKSSWKEAHEEKMESLTPAKAQIHLLDTVFKMFEFLSRTSRWNDATRLFDLEWNPRAKIQFEEDCEKLSNVHRLFQNKMWDQLEEIVWES